MLNKILKIIKENIYFIVLSITMILSFTIELPYYIEADGGLIDTNKRIEINTDYKTYGSINMAYVSEIKATPFSFLVAKIKKYDIEKQEKNVYKNETEEDVYFRSHLLLDEANSNAIILAYKEAKKNVNILSNECYVTYIDELADTDLKIGDKIISINNQNIKEKKDIYDIIKQNNVGATLNIKVIKDGTEYNRYAKLINYQDTIIIGIMITEKKEIKTTPNINIKFKSSESGSSGGLMMTLAIYNKLIEQDITNGLKLSGTGTIDEIGNVGSISGVKYKLKGAVKENADIFFVPNGDNYKEAIKEQKENNYDIEIIGVNTFKEVLEYLK